MAAKVERENVKLSNFVVTAGHDSEASQPSHVALAAKPCQRISRGLMVRFFCFQILRWLRDLAKTFPAGCGT